MSGSTDGRFDRLPDLAVELAKLEVDVLMPATPPGKAVPTLARCSEFGRMHVRNGQLPFPDLPRF